MIFSQLGSLFKNKPKPEFKYDDKELAYLSGFDKGFELGIHMASELDLKVKDKIRQQAMSETLERLRGNNTPHN